MPESLDIPATETTPGVLFDPQSRELRFEGESYPEDVHEFFAPILDWIEASIGPDSKLTVVLRLWYLNTGSTKSLLVMLRMLADKVAAGAEVDVVWCHLPDLELMREAGEELLGGCGLPYRIESVNTA
jgi:Domain of unknown function (DUF1987).